MTDIMPVTGYFIPEQSASTAIRAQPKPAPKFFTRLEWAQHATFFGFLCLLGLSPAGKLFPTLSLAIVPLGIVLLVIAVYLYIISLASWLRSHRSN